MSSTNFYCMTFVIQGNASGGKRAQYAGKMVNVLVDSAWEFINRASVLPDQPPSGESITDLVVFTGDYPFYGLDYGFTELSIKMFFWKVCYRLPVI